jgi:hypothetical protein
MIKKLLLDTQFGNYFNYYYNGIMHKNDKNSNKVTKLFYTVHKILLK